MSRRWNIGSVATTSGVVLLFSQDVSAQATSPTVPDLIRELQATKTELAKLKPAVDPADAGSTTFRFIKYGVTAGVSAALYTPGSPRNSLSGVAGGAMPFAGFFPGYWSGTGARNTFCAVEWSAPQSEAESAGQSQQSKEEQTAKKKVVEQASEKVSEAEREVDKAEAAAEAEKIVRSVQPNAQAPEVLGAASKTKDAEKKANDKLNEARDALKAAREEIKQLTKYDIKRMDEERDGLEALRKDREASLEATIEQYEQGKSATGGNVVSAPVEVLKQHARDYHRLHDEYRTCVTQKQQGCQAPTPAQCDKWVATQANMTDPSADLVGDAACKYVEVREKELTADKEYKAARDAYRGSNTNCAVHKVGFFFGYPAMFNASTYVESVSTPNDAKRDVTPIMSHGFVFAPNALVALTAGSWIGMADVTETETAVIWGMMAGAAITADIFSLIR